jgi:hypothetical protein
MAFGFGATRFVNWQDRTGKLSSRARARCAGIGNVANWQQLRKCLGENGMRGSGAQRRRVWKVGSGIYGLDGGVGRPPIPRP